ncbi:DUF4234 domain-containing protein [Gilliamella sp. wkB112]|uniref:DUF4234 domain-containing protein n=1 Tax=Gilliamella sp. wkB112 TaxID=3120257 RepID=UPI00080E613C|nr:DUF4234 domain-containing protein [Gilliamella apicola]OCG00812.1 hypothetical protein A9G12_03340 [Gilliamella apicola]
MKTIVELKKENNLSTFKFIIWSLITIGIYQLVWVYRVNKSIKKLLGVEVKSNAYIETIIILYFAPFFIALIGVITAIFYLKNLNNIIDYIGLFMWIEWANFARYVLTYYCLGEYNIKLKTKSFYVIIFNVFYINYLINYLGDEKRFSAN